MRSTEHTRVLEGAGLDAMLRRTRMACHRAVAAIASVGNDVIMDYPLTEDWRLHDLLGVLEGYDVTAVDVHCSSMSWTGGNALEEIARSAWRGPRTRSDTTIVT
jgi:chloramphenicol 3-O-phosphotransferase